MNTLVTNRVVDAIETRALDLRFSDDCHKPGVKTKIKAYQVFINKDTTSIDKSWWTNELVKDLGELNKTMKPRITFDELKKAINDRKREVKLENE